MRVAGLTGGIACGKSTVSRELNSCGIPVLDCDVIAHEVTRKGHWGYKRIVREFGKGVMLPNGELDREALAAAVFSAPPARRRLNRAVHLPVALALLRALAWHWLTFRPLVVVDMPLLFETGMHRWFRPVVVVHCSLGVQHARLVARNKLSCEAATARIDAQMPLHLKVAQADIVIDNNGGLEQLEAASHWLAHRLKREHGMLKALATSPLAATALVMAGVSVYRLLLVR